MCLFLKIGVDAIAAKRNHYSVLKNETASSEKKAPISVYLTL